MRASPLRHQLPVYSPISLADILRAAHAVQTGGTHAPAELEHLLRDRFDAQVVIPTGSGTQALTLGLSHALARSGSDIVALPAFTCYDVASAAVGANARVVLYDVDPDTLGPEPESLRRAFAAGARVAVAAALYGVPYDWSTTAGVAESFGALVIEDAAQAAGARWHNRMLGTLGNIAVLSFGRGKGWTGGGGGALLLRHDSSPPSLRAAPAASALPRVGAAAAQWLLGRPALYGVPRAIPWLHLGETVYHAPRQPDAMRPFAAALALATDPAARGELATRRARAALLLQLGLPTPAALPPHEDCGWLRFPVLLPEPRARRAALSLRRLGVERGYPTTLDALPVIRARRIARSPTPGAERLARELLTLPTHRFTSESELRQLAGLLRVYS